MNSLYVMFFLVLLQGSLSKNAASPWPICYDHNEEEVKNCHVLKAGPYKNGIPANFTISAGEEIHFDWMLDDFSYINQENPPNISIVASPCVGNVYLLVKPPLDPHPSYVNGKPGDNEGWSATYNYSDNALSVPLQIGRYYITVYAVEDSEFQIGLYILNDTLDLPDLQDDTVMDAKAPELNSLVMAGDLMTMNIFYNSTGIKGAKYEMYTVQHANRNETCGLKNKGDHPGDCVVKTSCGLKRLEEKGYAKISKQWNSTVDDNNMTTVGDLVQNVNYTFNIVVTLPEGLKLAYTGTEGTPEFHYEATAVDKTTTIVIIVVVCVIIVVVIIGMILLKIKLSKSYQKMT